MTITVTGLTSSAASDYLPGVAGGAFLADGDVGGALGRARCSRPDSPP